MVIPRFMITLCVSYIALDPHSGTHYKYSLTDIQDLIQQAEVFIQHALSQPPPHPPHSISHVTWRTQLTDLWLVHALSHYPVAGQNVVFHIITSHWEMA